MVKKIDIDIKNNESHPNRYGMYIPFGIQSIPKENLSDACKLLLCRIKALSKKKGYCFEYNIGLANDLGKSISTIIRLISSLKRNGYIYTHEATYCSGHYERRRIYPTDKTNNFFDKNIPHINNDETPPISNDYLSNRENISNKDKNKRGSPTGDYPLSFEEIAPTIKCPVTINKAISYYLNFFQNRFNKNHPRLRKAQWERVVQTLSTADLLSDDDDSWIDVIDSHFEKKYADGCNYHITHFASPKIIENRIYETCM